MAWRLSRISSLQAPTLCKDKLLKAMESNEPLHLMFTIRLTESTSVEWETIAWHHCLYIRASSCLLPEGSNQGSKEAFVALLEYTKETLHCTNIIACLPKDRSDQGLLSFTTNEEFCVEKDSSAESYCCHSLAKLVRIFMFLGFTVLPPTHALIPPGRDADYLYMLYTNE